MTPEQELFERRTELYERLTMLQEFLDFCEPKYRKLYKAKIYKVRKEIEDLDAKQEELNHTNAMEAAFGSHGQG